MLDCRKIISDMFLRYYEGISTLIRYIATLEIKCDAVG